MFSKQYCPYLWHRDELELALKFCLKSLKLQDEVGNPFEIAITLDTIGVIYQRKGEFDIALQHHKRGLKIKETLGTHSPYLRR
jgi:tetratricopeptide (TPR) repeat protein